VAKQTIKRKILSKLLIALILGLSFIGFLIVKHLSDERLAMPGHYVVDHVNQVAVDGKVQADTVYHRMRDFQMRNQVDKPVTLANLDNKVTLVSFFSTRDTRVAPHLARILLKVQRTFVRSDSGLHILSITTDPAYDTVGALKAYADHYDANHDIWWFLRGAPGQASDIAATDFQLTLERADSTSAPYSSTLVLLDKRDYVRGYYDAMDSASMTRCVTAISMLMLEPRKATQ
jgi:protein SCO1/2